MCARRKVFGFARISRYSAHACACVVRVYTCAHVNSICIDTCNSEIV
nr:MAG TPA: hypothetical protein [Caudoviricetes sp.]